MVYKRVRGWTLVRASLDKTLLSTPSLPPPPIPFSPVHQIELMTTKEYRKKKKKRRKIERNKQKKMYNQFFTIIFHSFHL